MRHTCWTMHKVSPAEPRRHWPQVVPCCCHLRCLPPPPRLLLAGGCWPCRTHLGRRRCSHQQPGLQGAAGHPLRCLQQQARCCRCSASALLPAPCTRQCVICAEQFAGMQHAVVMGGQQCYLGARVCLGGAVMHASSRETKGATHQGGCGLHVHASQFQQPPLRP